MLQKKLLIATMLFSSLLLSTGNLSAYADQSPSQAYLGERAATQKRMEDWQVSATNTRGRKALDAVKPVMLKYASLPLALVSEKIDGDKATLDYKSADPTVDMTIKVELNKADHKWTVTSQSYSGKDSLGIGTLPISGLVKAFPMEAGIITCALMAFAVSLGVYLLASLWLIVVAFQVSLPWGLVTMFVPFGNLIFVCTNWEKARKTFLVALAATITSTAALIVPPLVMASMKDVLDVFPESKNYAGLPQSQP